MCHVARRAVYQNVAEFVADQVVAELKVPLPAHGKAVKRLEEGVSRALSVGTASEVQVKSLLDEHYFCRLNNSKIFKFIYICDVFAHARFVMGRTFDGDFD